MLEKLKQALSSYTFLRPQDIIALVSITSFKSFKKGKYIIKEGELNYNAILVLSGLLRSFVIDEEGEERTMLFIPEKKNGGSHKTILQNEPSIENIIAVENSLVALADIRKIEKQIESSKPLLLYHNKILKEVLAFTVDQTFFHLVMTPEQRYIEFRKKFPKLEQRITQKDLASYLGITATSLSRIRARISK